jgi:putative ABC transport system substrate-binding protein
VGLLLYDSQTFIDEMTRLGYEEGKDISYMMWSYDPERTPEQVAEQQALETQAMLDLPVDVLIATNDSDAVELLEQTTAIPIVFVISDDPVATGAVADLTTPGGNITGIVSNQHHQRRLQLLAGVDPTTKKVLYLYFPSTAESTLILEQVQALGEELGIEVIGAPITDVPSGLEQLESIPDDIDWLFLTPYVPIFDVEFHEALVNTSIEQQAPIAGFWASAMPGYLINYGPDLTWTTQQSAQITDRILRGANPGDLPVITAENGLVVNLEMAEALNMEIPVPILRQANIIVRPGDLDNFMESSE